MTAALTAFRESLHAREQIKVYFNAEKANDFGGRAEENSRSAEGTLGKNQGGDELIAGSAVSIVTTFLDLKPFGPNN